MVATADSLRFLGELPTEGGIIVSTRRILFVSPLSGLGGGETSLLNLMMVLKASSHYEPLLWLFKDGPLGERASNHGIRVHVQALRASTKKLGPVPLVPVADVLAFRRFLKDERVELVHLNGLDAVWSIGLAACLASVPVVWTCYGAWLQFKVIHRWVLTRLLSRIVGTTEPIMKYLREQGFLPDQLSLVPLGVDIGQVEAAPVLDLREELGLPADAFLTGVVARFQSVKGQDIFVKAAALVASSHPAAAFVLVGGLPFGNPADAEFRDSVYTMAQDERLRGRIFFLGERPDVASIMKGLDLLVVPSTSESFGMVIIEAMAVNCPVLATACEGPKVIIDQEVTGLLVPVKDHTALANAMLRIATDSELRNRLCENGAREVRRKYSVASQAKQHTILYNSLVERR